VTTYANVERPDDFPCCRADGAGHDRRPDQGDGDVWADRLVAYGYSDDEITDLRKDWA
jgi:hypothetical protein